MEKIRCRVLRILYNNKDNGYTVFSAEKEDKTIKFVVFGTYYEVTPESTLDVEGNWEWHQKYGKQFKAISWSEVLPSTVEGMKRYLSSGFIPGIGPKIACQIVSYFQERTFDVIKNDPDRLYEIPHLGKKRVSHLVESIRKQGAVRDIMVFLQGNGVSSAYATRIFKVYGVQSISKIKKNPYSLVDDVAGIGFKMADKIARQIGFDLYDGNRLSAGIVYVINEKLKNGDVFQQLEQLISCAEKVLEVGTGYIRHVMIELIKENRLINDNGCIYLPMYYHSEIGIAKRIAHILLEETDEKKIGNLSIEGNSDIQYSPQQQEAIKMASMSKILVLTGGPGTGKTTVVKGIIAIMEKMFGNESVLLAAPTGRAAKRMSEATGMEAKTIHRLLGYSPQDGKFQRDEENPLIGSVLILDESSMVDQLLMNSLLKAIPSGMRLVLVGDVDQLPSVGAGNILRDIINSGTVPVVRLNQIFRQSSLSSIIVNAHRVNNGLFPETSNEKDCDFFIISEKDDQKAATTTANLMSWRLESMGFTEKDIQILCPMRKASLTGCDNVNKIVQELLNPQGQSIPGHDLFRKGDRVMQMKNNYKNEVFNGDIGTITSYDSEEGTVEVTFQNKTVCYDEGEIDELALSYATTIHKSQGSEFPVVIIPIMKSAWIMLQRNLLYTAITRAKKLCIIVGDKQAIQQCVNNNLIQKRNTKLSERLREYIKFV